VELLRKHGLDLPDLSQASLKGKLDEWLLPYLAGITRMDDVKKLDFKSILSNFLTREQRTILEKNAPDFLIVPSGSKLKLEYKNGEVILAVKLQEMFGATETPSILGGRIPITLHLLSPAKRPIQITRDLPGFWSRTYAEVRRELRGRYPRHPWPEDPRTAVATRFTKKRSS